MPRARSSRVGSHYAAALNLWKALALAEKFVGRDDPSVAPILLLLAEVQANQGRQERAEELRERARRIWAWAQTCDEVN